MVRVWRQSLVVVVLPARKMDLEWWGVSSEGAWITWLSARGILKVELKKVLWKVVWRKRKRG